jgi:hypothetical protein
LHPVAVCFLPAGQAKTEHDTELSSEDVTAGPGRLKPMAN